MSPLIDTPEDVGEQLVTLRAEVADRGFDYLLDDNNLSPRIDRAVNTGHRRLIEEERWPFLEITLTCGNETNLAPLLAIVSVRAPDVGELKGTDYQELRRQNVDLTEEGVPTCFYVREGDTLCVHPVWTAEDLEVRYFVGAIKLVEDADTSQVPERFSDILLDAACRELEKDRHNWNAVAGLEADYIAGVSRMRDSLFSQQQADNPVIGYTGGDWA